MSQNAASCQPGPVKLIYRVQASFLGTKSPAPEGGLPQLFTRSFASIGQATQVPGRGRPRHGREHKKSDAVDPLPFPSSRESAEILGPDKVPVFAELLLGWGLVAESTAQQFD